MTDDASGWEMNISIFGSGVRFRWITRDISDIEVCTTRIVRSGRGFPWDERVAVHPMPDGSIEVIGLRADETQGEEHPC